MSGEMILGLVIFFAMVFGALFGWLLDRKS